MIDDRLVIRTDEELDEMYERGRKALEVFYPPKGAGEERTLSVRKPAGVSKKELALIRTMAPYITVGNDGLRINGELRKDIRRKYDEAIDELLFRYHAHTQMVVAGRVEYILDGDMIMQYLELKQAGKTEEEIIEILQKNSRVSG